MKKFLSHLLEPRSIILGITVFYFVCSSTLWTRGPGWDYRLDMFVATVLLISAAALVVNRIWGDLISAVISGQSPLLFLVEFWMLSWNAELPLFSAQHIKLWIGLLLDAGATPILWLTLSSVILSYSAVSILRRSTALPAAACPTGIHPFEKSLDRLPL